MATPILSSDLPRTQLYNAACEQFQDHLEIFYQDILKLNMPADVFNAVYEAAGRLMGDAEQCAFAVGYNMAVAACDAQPVESNLIVFNWGDKMNETRYQAYITLTPDESIKLTELSKKLKLSKSKTVGLLLNKAQVLRNSKYGKFRLAEDSLLIEEGTTE